MNGKIDDITFLRKYGGKIKKIQVLINKIEIDPSNPTKVHKGDEVHAWFVRRFIETKKFTVTAVEISDGRGIDIDIELNNNINIQVFHSFSASNRNIFNKNKVSPLGGVETEWSKDEKSFNKKVKQLPNTGLGLVFCCPNSIGINILPEWICGLPDTKAVVEFQNYGNGVISEVILHYSNNFKYLSLTEDILKTLGFGVKSVINF